MIENIQKRFDDVLSPDNFFKTVKNYCLICGYFTLDNDKYCENEVIEYGIEKCEEFELRNSLKEALNG